MACILCEVVNRCAQREFTKRPSFAVLLESFRDVRRARDAKKSKGMLGKLSKLSDKTEAFISSELFGMASATTGGRKTSGMQEPGANAPQTACTPDGVRMVRLSS